MWVNDVVDIKRNTGLDFMKFICMFMIISLHYFGEGVLNNSGASQINALFGSFIVVLFCGAIDCFL